MQFVKNKTKIPISLVVIAVFIFSIGILSTPKQAEAQVGIAVPTSDLANQTINTGNASSNTTSLIAQQGKCVQTTGPGCKSKFPVSWSLDSLASVFAKQASVVMVQSVTNWVKTGFNGKPAFVTDLKKYTQGFADSVAIGLVKDMTGANICAGFPDISVDLRVSTLGSARFVPECTLKEVKGNAKAFFNQFSDGNWLTYQSSLSSNNNPFGLYISSQEEYDRRLYGAESRAKQELAWGRGFLSFKDSKTGEIKTPGVMINSKLGNVMGYDLRSKELVTNLNALAQALLGQVVKGALSETGFLN